MGMRPETYLIGSSSVASMVTKWSSMGPPQSRCSPIPTPSELKLAARGGEERKSREGKKGGEGRKREERRKRGERRKREERKGMGKKLKHLFLVILFLSTGS